MEAGEWRLRQARAGWCSRIAGIAGLAFAAALSGAATAPASAQSAASIGENEAWDYKRAWTEMERLQAEIAVLKGLAAAQAALLALNRERFGSGSGPAVLDARLCEEPALEGWCRALPATFGGRPEGGAGQGRAEDGER